MTERRRPRTGATSTRTSSSATESAPPETATRTVSPPRSIPWRRIVRSARAASAEMAEPSGALVPVLTLRLEPDPDLAVLEVFLLPHRDGFLQRVDGEVAGLEGLAPVGRGHGDHHARLADLEPADAMDHRHADRRGPARPDRPGDLPHLGEGHGRVRLVLEELHPAPPRLVPHDAGKQRDGPRARVADRLGHRALGERVAGDVDPVGRAGAAAHRREETQLV